MSSEYVVRKGPTRWEARVFSGDENGEEIAEIRKGDDFDFKLTSLKDGQEWLVTNRVHGEYRPFSFSVLKADDKGRQGAGDGSPDKGKEILVVRDNLFRHNDKFYMLANNPEGKPWQEYATSPVRYISRLENFPYSRLEELDDPQHHYHHQLGHKLKRFRGVPVGEASGLGIGEKGHTVRVGEELKDIGLFLAVTSYLIYASA